jgi:diguanylate cyclase (GGDEF)-like protein/PAS domain S-box-containing protein
MENLYEGVYVVDKDRKILFWNEGCEKITGYQSSEVVNTFCFNNILQHVDQSGKSLCAVECPLSGTIDSGKVLERDVFLHHKMGYRVPVTVKSIPVFDEFKNVIAAIEVFTDARFKESKLEENRQLKKIIDIDPLTKIYNRRFIDFQLETVLKEYEEFKSPFGIIFIDIDHFKNVNDTYGHTVGDEILKVVTKTIGNNIRPSDVVGRFGGEEFIVIAKRIELNTLKVLCERIRVLCKNSYYNFKKKKLSVTISIGATLYNGSETINELIARADKLMYKSKDTGRNKCTVE